MTLESLATPRPVVSPAHLAGRTISRVMIVDDNPEIHRLLKARLEARGFIVQSAEDGEAALAPFKDFSPDVAFLDVTMPRLGGLDVLQVIRAQNLDMAVVLTAPMGLEQMAINALRHGADDYLPVLVITAQPGHKLRALQAGAKDFISKPFDLAEVLTRVRNMLEVRLLHVELKNYSTALEQTVREVEASREVIRRQSDEVRSLYDQVVIEQKLSERLLLNVLPDAIAVRPDEEIGQLGHTIKETGRGYGFDGITEIGSAIERAAHHEDGEAVDTRISHLSEYLHRVHVVE